MFQAQKKLTSLTRLKLSLGTVNGSEIQRSPVEVGSVSHIFAGIYISHVFFLVF